MTLKLCIPTEDERANNSVFQHIENAVNYKILGFIVRDRGLGDINYAAGIIAETQSIEFPNTGGLIISPNAPYPLASNLKDAISMQECFFVKEDSLSIVFFDYRSNMLHKISVFPDKTIETEKHDIFSYPYNNLLPSRREIAFHISKLYFENKHSSTL